jgi:DNA polymerase-3 subunit epsilon
VKEYRTLVNPGVTIPASATKVHKITDAVVQGCRICELTFDVHGPNGKGEPHEFKPWPTFKQLAPNLVKGFSGCDFAGKNVRFDLRITAAEMQRAGVEWRYDGARIIDGDRLESLLNPRSLSHLYRKYAGKVLDGAHGALADVRASTTVIEGQLHAPVEFPELSDYSHLPKDLDELHQLQWPDWIDCDGFFRFVDGVACVGRWGKHAGKPMTHPDLSALYKGTSYWDFILGGDFPADVKHLAAEAKMGRFPK